MESLRESFIRIHGSIVRGEGRHVVESGVNGAGQQPLNLPTKEQAPTVNA